MRAVTPTQLLKSTRWVRVGVRSILHRGHHLCTRACTSSPTGMFFYSGATTQSRTFNTSTHAWANVATTKSSGTRTYGTSILLPLTPPNYVPQVIIMGGGNPSTATTETIDL